MLSANRDELGVRTTMPQQLRFFGGNFVEVKTSESVLDRYESDSTEPSGETS